MAKKKEVKKAAAPQATEEIVVVKKPRVKPIGKPVKNEVAKAEAAPAAKPAAAPRTKKVAAPVVNLYRAELFTKKGEQFNEVFVGAGSYDEALAKVNASDFVSKKGAEIQSLYKVNNGANPNTIYLP